MIKEKKNNTQDIIFILITSIAVAIMSFLSFFSDSETLTLELKILLSLGIGIITSIITWLLIKFKVLKFETTKKEDKDNLNKLLEGMTSDEIRNKIKLNKELNKYNEEFEKKGWKLISKRKELTYKEKGNLDISGLITAGYMILFIGLIYLGAIPAMFGVNNEFTNPSNASLGLNASFDLAQKAITDSLFINFMDTGAERPVFWFWFFWIIVACFFVYPIFKSIYYYIKHLIQGGKK
jgi:hypothetical protein